jgi:hypothetical protein
MPLGEGYLAIARGANRLTGKNSAFRPTLLLPSQSVVTKFHGPVRNAIAFSCFDQGVSNEDHPSRPPRPHGCRTQ